MPTYQFEAMDATGQEIKDEIDAESEDEAQAIIRQQGYFITKIALKKARKQAAAAKKSSRKRGFAIGGVSSKTADRLHSPALHPAGCRPAHPPQPADSGRPMQTWQTAEFADGYVRGNRGRVDPV